ncbi:MAG: DnaJ domain-containing protein [Candidatus Omnitrophota bacterium]
MKDYYAILKVAKSASRNEIKAAYRKLAFNPLAEFPGLEPGE